MVKSHVIREESLTSSLPFKVLIVLLLAGSVIQIWYYCIVVYVSNEYNSTIQLTPYEVNRPEPNEYTNLPPHLYPPLPPLPPFATIPNGDQLSRETLEGKPTISGIAAILTKFLLELHETFKGHARNGSERDEIITSYIELAQKHLFPLDAPYRGTSMFPIRDDDSMFVSIASFRDHLLGQTLIGAFEKATNPEKLYVGTIVQNCFGEEYTCKTGAEVVGKNKFGVDQTKVSDAPPDANGVKEFCETMEYKKYCDAGQIRVLYVNETESLGPAVARYYASKLWGGETYYVQIDSHLQFAQDWDSRYIDELKTAGSYPKVILSAYPPGFEESRDSPGTRLCSCVFSNSKVEFDIIRINTAGSTPKDALRPTQIAYIAAGFFFTRAEFLIDVPFDPLLPWCFMGEEISLSMRAWTSGWNIYAPRKNIIKHQYRPGRMGIPKFWGTVGRVFNHPGPHFNTLLQEKMIQRIKNLVGYPESSRDLIEQEGDVGVLKELEHYALGHVRTREKYLDLVGIDLERKECHNIMWCNKGEYE